MLTDGLRAAGVRTAVRAVAGWKRELWPWRSLLDGERLMRSARGANEALDAKTCWIWRSRDVAAVHLTGYALLGPAGLSLLEAAGTLAGRHSALLSFDPSSPGVIERVGRERLMSAMTSAGVDLLLPNAEEAVSLSGAASVAAAANRLAHLVPAVAIKTGETGAVYATAGETVLAPTDRVQSIDTTGAGDAFNAGLLVARLRGDSLNEACQFAHSVAAQAIARYGGRPV